MSRGKLTEQHFSKEVLKTSGLPDNFWSFRDNGGNFFRVGKTAKDIQGNSLWKIFLKTEKLAFFSILNVFLLLAKTFARFAKPAIWICVEVMGEKLCFNYLYSFTLLWTLIHKTLSRKVFSRVVTTAIRASRDIFWSKVFFLGKVRFVHLFWSLSNFFVFRQKKLGSQRNNLLIQKTNWRKEFVEKSFFKTSSDFQQKSLNN